MRFSYSNISTWKQCPYKWFLRYMLKLKTIPDTKPDNALNLGLGLHTGIELGVDAGIQEYKSHYNILTDAMINWIIQLEYQIPRVIDLLPKGGEHEVEVKTDNFIGYIDYLCGDTLYDFKFSNNVDRYVKSPQLSIYKYYLEQVRPDIKINHLKYVFVPKVMIRQKRKSKPPETLNEFRTRLRERLESTYIKNVEVDYDEQSIHDFEKECNRNRCSNSYPKQESRLCDWCEYRDYCQSDGQIDWMIYKD